MTPLPQTLRLTEMQYWQGIQRKERDVEHASQRQGGKRGISKEVLYVETGELLEYRHLII